MPFCKSCKKEFYYLRTSSGKLNPVDVDSLSQSHISLLIAKMEVMFDPKIHTSHFITCPEAKKFRKPKQKTALPVGKFITLDQSKVK